MSGELNRVLSKRDVFVLAVGAMIGWGWIVQTGYFINTSGVYGAIAAFALGGFMVGVVSLVYGELAAAMPEAGGEHVYSMRALGPRGSFACTWALIFGYVSVVAFEAVALPSALAYIVPGFNVFKLWTIAGQPVYATWVFTGVVGSLLITYLNYRGARPAAQFQAILTVLIALAGITLFVGATFHGHSPSTSPLGGAGWGGILSVAIMTPFFFVGFDVVPQAAGEADFSPAFLGTLIAVSVAFAAAFYIAVIWGAGQTATGAALSKSSLPAAKAMQIVFQNATAGRLMALAGVAGILTSWNGFIVGASRAIYSLAESKMLPRPLAEIHTDHGTPGNAVLLVGLVGVLAPLFGEKMLVWVVDAGGLGLVVAWLLVVVSFFVLRYREPDMDRPLKLPAGSLIGGLGLLMTLIFVFLYLPWSPSALEWPHEWGIIIAWAVLGIALIAVSGGFPSRAEAESKMPSEEI